MPALEEAKIHKVDKTKDLKEKWEAEMKKDRKI